MTSNRESIEYRIVCSDLESDGHRGHAWHISPKNGKTPDTRAALLADRNADPALDGLPFYRTCKPYRIECRYISDWTDDFDRVEELIA